MIEFAYKRKTLVFSFNAKTSRGVLKTRDVFYVFLIENGITGIGEAAPINGLSIETSDEVNSYLNSLDSLIPKDIEIPKSLPSVKFAFEMALLDLKNGGKRLQFETNFLKGTPIPINGLVWMGSEEFMQEQIEQKLEQGFKCIKLKIGSLDWDRELSLLTNLRRKFDHKVLQIRVDANGGFDASTIHNVMHSLDDLDVHSIEQPIIPGQYKLLAELNSIYKCKIALDEELIGKHSYAEKEELIKKTKPGFLVLKPSLLGGYNQLNEWIQIASQYNLQWWVTSYLESNLGLNAIAQFVSQFDNNLYQGLGTGHLFVQNIGSPLEIKQGALHYNNDNNWEYSMLKS